jgi:predicted N-formylglutamate amidohydrolase
MSTPYRVIGNPRADGILIVADHASNLVPASIDLGLSEDQLSQHIAWDIGVAGVAERLCLQFGYAAFLGGVSRLVVDCNRERDIGSVIPKNSDDVHIKGNILNAAQHEERLATYYDPYHNALSQLLKSHRPALILSLHSFTPMLRTDPVQSRPWEIGILYNEYETASHWMIEELNGAGFKVGDQQPYSGKQLNATMNRHAEGNDIPYIGIEMRQDLVTEEAGIDRFVQIIGQSCNKIAKKLATP